MLHGDPQTHLCWHRVAPALSADHTVVLADLRGRGESHKPPPAAGHDAFSKRTTRPNRWASCAVSAPSAMPSSGRIGGPRVARRMALDHPDRVSALAVVDIVPAIDLYERTTAAMAQDYYYLFFLTQAHPLAERMIADAAEDFMRGILTGLGGDVPCDPAALALDLHTATRPEAIAAMCECFRAGITCDRAHDAADRAAARRIACPTLAMWGAQGVAGRHFDMAATWRAWAPDIRLAPVPAGHFIPEEAPEETLAALRCLRRDAA